MLNPFSNKGSTRDKTLSAEILKSRIRATDLGREIAEGEAEIIIKRDELAQLYSPGNDTAAIDRTTTALAAAEVPVKGKIAALAKLENQVAAKENELADFRDAEIRKRTIEQLQVREHRFDAASKSLLAALEEYAAATGAIAPVVPEAQQLHIFAHSLAVNELPVAADLVTTLLGNYVRAIQSRTAPAALPQPAAPAAKPVLVALPEETRLFTLKPVRWCDPGNPQMVRFHPQFAPLSLPPDLAEKAIAANLAISVVDKRVGELRRAHAPSTFTPNSVNGSALPPMTSPSPCRTASASSTRPLQADHQPFGTMK
jgi:hypothetical protein